mmetsp:Transcript_6595/g.19463  ORF Transcript_6595/g.19463 Transcript_6595/m.19463 type:complete len:193 (-) Transcript_6595:47-625(-)
MSSRFSVAGVPRERTAASAAAESPALEAAPGAPPAGAKWGGCTFAAVGACPPAVVMLYYRNYPPCLPFPCALVSISKATPDPLLLASKRRQRATRHRKEGRDGTGQIVTDADRQGRREAAARAREAERRTQSSQRSAIGRGAAEAQKDNAQSSTPTLTNKDTGLPRFDLTTPSPVRIDCAWYNLTVETTERI